jgi:octaprenyl-diphosphate synthase
LNLSEIEKLASPELGAAEEIIEKTIAGEAGILGRVSDDAYSRRRKRTRPLTLILAAKSLGCHGGELPLYSAVVELIHTSTLIHDDIIDKASLRRGKPTLNIKWGEALALLFGDQLFLRALRLAFRGKKDGILSLIMEGMLEMIEGEARERMSAGDLSLSFADYLETTRKKTGALFSVSARIGAILGSAGRREKEAFSQFGYLFGSAFQIADDILDFIKTEDKLAKSLGNDLPQGKITLPVIYLLTEGEDEERILIDRVIQEKGYCSVSRDELIKNLSACAFKKAYRTAYQLVTKAVESLFYLLPPSEERDALISLAFLTVERARIDQPIKQRVIRRIK